MSQAIAIRIARASDVPAMCDFIFTHGVNQWNFLPEDSVRAHLRGIASGKTHALVAETDAELAGFVSFMHGTELARYQAEDRAAAAHGYVCEAVVHHALAGQGIGSRLLQEAVARLTTLGFEDIYIERHEENLASAGMMRKAGFAEIDTFDDPERRISGSRRTTVCRFVRATLLSSLRP